MRIREEADILFSEMVRMRPEEVAPVAERISKAIEGEEAARASMSLAAVLLIAGSAVVYTKKKSVFNQI